MTKIDLLKETELAKTIGIAGHERPDGDCVGSILSLYHYLINAGRPEPDLYLEEPSFIFNSLKDIEKIHHTADKDITYDVFIICDTDNSRIGHAAEYFRKAKKTINIDHHISNADGCADVNYVEPHTGSCCEVLSHLYDRKYFDGEIAVELFTGVIHDTGVMQYSSTTPDTYRLAAELIGYGFDFTHLIEESFYEKTYRQQRLLGRALTDSFLALNDRVIVSALPLSVLKEYDATAKTTDGIVAQLKKTRGADVAVFLYELSEGEYKISLRSNEKVDVSVAAAAFGGGGHARAAGLILHGSKDELIPQILSEIEKQL